MIKSLSTVLFLLLVISFDSFGQCAMCKTTIVNNVSNGELSIAQGLNFGILYLFITPYLAIALVAFFWYRTSKSNARKKQYKSYS